MLNFFYHFNGFNVKIFQYINFLGNQKFFPYLLAIISSLFSTINCICYCAIIYLAFIIYLYLKRHTQSVSYFWPIYYRLVKISIIFALALIIYTFLKYSINLPRPYCSLGINEFLSIKDFKGVRCLSSFPSAHIAWAILISYTAWPYLNIPLKILFGVIVTMVAISRITLAMHYPADILYSLIIISFLILIGNLIFHYLEKHISFIGRLMLKYIL